MSRSVHSHTIPTLLFAEKLIHAGQATCSYALRIPPPLTQSDVQTGDLTWIGAPARTHGDQSARVKPVNASGFARRACSSRISARSRRSTWFVPVSERHDLVHLRGDAGDEARCPVVVLCPFGFHHDHGGRPMESTVAPTTFCGARSNIRFEC